MFVLDSSEASTNKKTCNRIEIIGPKSLPEICSEEDADEEDEEVVWSLNSIACHPQSLCYALRMSTHQLAQPEVRFHNSQSIL